MAIPPPSGRRRSFAMADAKALPAPAVQYETPEQEHHTQTFAIWVFLATEVMLFSALFTGYTVYRLLYRAAFVEASQHLEVNLAGVMTAVLLVSSLTIALALHTARTNHRWLTSALLAATIVLGCVFLGLKGLEYYHHYQDHMAPGIDFAYPGSQPRVAQ